MTNILRVAVLMGGPSAEHEVSLNTGAMVVSALDRERYEVTAITIPKTAKWEDFSALIDQLKKTNIDVAFLALHGEFGEDGTVQALLEATGIKYTGSHVLASALAMEKEMTSKLFASNGLEVPREVVVKKGEPVPALEVPCFVKPANLGSSVGVSLVRQKDEIAKAIERGFAVATKLLVQELVEGDEVTCGVLDEGDGKNATALPPTQIIPKIGKFFDYASKYEIGGSEEVTPPRMPAETIKKIQQIALQAHALLGCSGYSRTDMIVTPTRIVILETNTLPGMTKTSLLPQAAAVAGITFPKLLDRIIAAAITT